MASIITYFSSLDSGRRIKKNLECEFKPSGDVILHVLYMRVARTCSGHRRSSYDHYLFVYTPRQRRAFDF